MTWAVGVFWIILKQQVSCFFYSRFRSKGLSLGGLKNCTNFKISFRIFRRLSTGTFDLEKRMITSLLLMIPHRMHWYILEVMDLGEIFVCALFDGPFYYSHCPSNYSITSRDCIISPKVPDMQPIIWAGFKIVNQSNNQEPAVFVEGKGSVLHHSVGALLAQKEYQDHRQQPRRSHQCEQLCSGRGEEGMMLVDIQWRLLCGLHLVPGGCAKAGGS